MSRKRAVGKRCPITRSQWDKMLSAYREKPTILFVQNAGGCGKRAARRAIMEGWPDHGFPPFTELRGQAAAIHKEMSVYRENWAEASVTQGEASRQAAEEAMAARIVMDAALKTSRLAQGYAAKVLERLEQDPEAMIPDDITPKIVLQLCTSLEKSATVVEKAMKVAQMRAGKPETVLGVEIGILIDRCSDDELEIVADTGELPGRIIDARRNIRAMAATAATEEEAAALAEVENDGQPEDYSEGEGREDQEDQEDQEGLEQSELQELTLEEIEEAVTG